MACIHARHNRDRLSCFGIGGKITAERNQIRYVLSHPLAVHPNFYLAMHAHKGKPWNFSFPFSRDRHFLAIPAWSRINMEEPGGFPLPGLCARANRSALFLQKLIFIFAQLLL